MSELDTAARALIERLEREVARADAPRTTRVGGYNLAGTELERLLRVAASLACRATGTTLERELARAGVTKGAGSYLRVLIAAGAHDSSEPLVRAIAIDGRVKTTSRLQRLVDLRNEAAHQPDRVDDVVAKRVMRTVLDWLRPHVPRT